MHVAVRGQLQGLVTVPFTLNIITPKIKMTGFCLFVCTGVLKDWTQDFIHAIQAFYQTFHYARDLCVLKVETILKSCSEKLCFFACSVFCYRILDFSLAAVTNTDTHLPCSHSSVLVKAISWFIASAFTASLWGRSSWESLLWVHSLHSGFASAAVTFLELLAFLILSLWAEDFK